MASVFYGALGALMTLALLALGFAAGWTARGMAHPRRAAAHGGDEQRLLEEQRAFENMLHYNMDTAYGLNTPWEELVGGEHR